MTTRIAEAIAKLREAREKADPPPWRPMNTSNSRFIALASNHWAALMNILDIAENILIVDLDGYNERRLTEALTALAASVLGEGEK